MVHGLRVGSRMNAPHRDTDLAWQLFASCVAKRLEAGRREYGDRSFSRDPLALVAELQEEALDLAGWGFILWCRLQRMRDVIDATLPESSKETR
jgi:hypothetical protein